MQCRHFVRGTYYRGWGLTSYCMEDSRKAIFDKTAISGDCYLWRLLLLEIATLEMASLETAALETTTRQRLQLVSTTHIALASVFVVYSK